MDNGKWRMSGGLETARVISIIRFPSSTSAFRFQLPVGFFPFGERDNGGNGGVAGVSPAEGVA